MPIALRRSTDIDTLPLTVDSVESDTADRETIVFIEPKLWDRVLGGETAQGYSSLDPRVSFCKQHTKRGCQIEKEKPV